MCVDHLKMFSGMLDEPIIHPSIIETHQNLTRRNNQILCIIKIQRQFYLVWVVLSFSPRQELWGSSI